MTKPENQPRHPPQPAPRFVCDAMLGGLAKWLRAAGYDADWADGVEDAELVERARGRPPQPPDDDPARTPEQDAIGPAEPAVLLTSDTGIMERRVVANGQLPVVFIAPGLRTQQQLALVFERLGLTVREPRCMKCGGTLLDAPKADLADEVPPVAYAHHDEFFRCARCRKLYWRGTHWSQIQARLAALNAPHRELNDLAPDSGNQTADQNGAGGKSQTSQDRSPGGAYPQ